MSPVRIVERGPDERKRLALEGSLYKLLQTLSVTLFAKTLIPMAVFDVGSQFDRIDDGNQLQLFDLLIGAINR